MSRRMFPHTCDVKRAVAIGTNGRKQKQTHSTGNDCLFVPMSARQEVENGFTVGSAYDVYFPDAGTNVKSGDQLVWDSKTFNVRAAAPYQVTRVGHLHVLATREGA